MDFLTRQIERYQKLGTQGYETNTTAIANTLLDFAKKTPSHGYIIRDECIMRAISTVVLAVSENIKADKAVHQETVHPNRVSVIPYEKPVVVVECKHHSNLNDEFSKDDFDQITQYMIAAKFPNGILLSEFNATVLVGKYSGKIPQIEIVKDLKLAQNSSELIEILSEM